jgi:hypothetical protein
MRIRYRPINLKAHTKISCKSQLMTLLDLKEVVARIYNTIHYELFYSNEINKYINNQTINCIKKGKNY